MWMSTRLVVAAAGSTAITANPAAKTRPNATSPSPSAIRPQATVNSGGPPELTASRAAARSAAEQEGSCGVGSHRPPPKEQHQGEPERQRECRDGGHGQPLAGARHSDGCEVADEPRANRRWPPSARRVERKVQT